MFYQVSDNAFSFMDDASSQFKELDPGVWKLTFNPNTGARHYVRVADTLRTPAKIYGQTNDITNRIVNSYEIRRQQGKNTGFIFDGVAGSGKTIQSSEIGNEMIKRGYIVINVEQFPVGVLISMIQDLSQPVLVLFDEFEKTFDKEDQERLLTLFDGNLSSGIMFGVVMNDPGRCTPYIFDRTGRFLYRISYDGLDKTTIQEFVEDNLEVSNPHFDELVETAVDLETCTFDILSSLTAEAKMYPQLTFEQMTSILNVNTRNRKPMTFAVELMVDNMMVYSSKTQHIDIHHQDIRQLKRFISSGHKVTTDKWALNFVQHCDGYRLFEFNLSRYSEPSAIKGLSRLLSVPTTGLFRGRNQNALEKIVREVLPTENNATKAKHFVHKDFEGDCVNTVPLYSASENEFMLNDGRDVALEEDTPIPVRRQLTGLDMDMLESVQSRSRVHRLLGEDDVTAQIKRGTNAISNVVDESMWRPSDDRSNVTITGVTDPVEKLNKVRLKMSDQDYSFVMKLIEGGFYIKGDDKFIGEIVNADGYTVFFDTPESTVTGRRVDVALSWGDFKITVNDESCLELAFEKQYTDVINVDTVNVSLLVREIPRIDKSQRVSQRITVENLV